MTYFGQTYLSIRFQLNVAFHTDKFQFNDFIALIMMSDENPIYGLFLANILTLSAKCHLKFHCLSIVNIQIL